MRHWISVLGFAWAIVGCATGPNEATPGSATGTSSLTASVDPVVHPEMNANTQADIDNDAADRAFNMVARIRLSEDHTVLFYEPSPGHIVLSEEARYPAQPMLRGLQSLPPTEIHRLIAPDVSVPDSLVAAEQRARALASAGTDSVPVAHLPTVDREPAVLSERAPQQIQAPVDEQPLDATGPCPDAWFQQNFCSNPSDVSVSVCLLDWWNGAWANSTGDHDASTAVCPITAGNVLFTVNTSDHNVVWTIAQGTYRYFHEWNDNPWSSFDMNSSVSSASGHKFQFALWAF